LVTKVEVAQVPPPPQAVPVKSASLQINSITRSEEYAPYAYVSASVAVAYQLTVPPGLMGEVLRYAVNVGR
jgi:hypothetical protein